MFLGEVMRAEAVAETKPEVQGVVVLLCGLQAGPEGAKNAHAVLEFVMERQAETKGTETGAQMAGEFTHEEEGGLVVRGLQPEGGRPGEEIEGRDKLVEGVLQIGVGVSGEEDFFPAPEGIDAGQGGGHLEGG
ncbi:hypothetical protein [Deinococcus gobiensis]|uniref:hypothetical protein n=1 Tax=Deinococcus gobiensis TaxID=502394 RepID=UPI0011AE4547|nr:hypothetical protein [Deinococcus gobiensis]